MLRQRNETFSKLLMHLNINSLLPKIDKLRYNARFSNATVVGFSGSKLHKSITYSEILIDNYDVLRCDRNRNRRSIAPYIRNDLSYALKNLFSNHIENVFFEIHLSKTELITVGIVSRIKLISLKSSMKTLRNLIPLIQIL